MQQKKTLATTPPSSAAAELTPPGVALLAVRLDTATVARLDRLAARLSFTGMRATRTDAHRIAVLAGLSFYEQNVLKGELPQTCEPITRTKPRPRTTTKPSPKKTARKR